VKKTISIIALSALFSAAVLVLVCTDGKYDNPLDERGTNYLYGDTADAAGKMNSSSKNSGCVNVDGVAALFCDTSKYKQCDGAVPEIKIVEPKSVTINTQQVTEFRKWMHLDGGPWSDLISWDTARHKNVITKEPRLAKGSGDVSYNPNQVPDEGTYFIWYRIEKKECNGNIPGSEGSRTLKVELWVPPDTATPRLTLVGLGRVEIKEGKNYSEEGVTVMLGSQDITREALDSVVLKRNSGARVEGWTKPVDFSKVAIPANTPANTGFTITYYASRNGKPTTPATVVRNVTVTENQVVGVKGVIVLTPYKHNIKGKVIEHPDTMMFGGTYVEKGARAYYVKDGAEVAIDANSVVKPSGSNTTMPSSVDNPGQRSLQYTLPAGAGYSQADPVSRNVYLVVRGCDAPADPVITAGGDTTIAAGTEWNYSTGWSVANKDKDGDQAWSSAGRKYLIDFAGLDPKKPKAGTYKITYVGLGACGSIATKERTITVK